MLFSENASRVRVGHSAVKLAIVQRMSLNLINQNKTIKEIGRAHV